MAETNALETKLEQLIVELERLNKLTADRLEFEQAKLNKLPLEKQMMFR